MVSNQYQNNDSDVDLDKSRLFTMRLGDSATFAPLWEDVNRALGAEETYEKGRIIEGKYRIDDLIGRGGMGVVYRARQLALNKDVALKTFLRADIKEEDWVRFKREAQSIARLNDSGVVQVFDFGVDSGRPYYTMELLKGQGLDDYLQMYGAMSVREALDVFIQVAHGLAAAHRKGVVHRDIKPANIFLVNEGKRLSARIVDFGIASLMSDQTEHKDNAVEVFGSPLYMSPEQFRGDNPGAASDIYSFGCTFFEALTGRPPFRGANVLATMYLHFEQAPPKLSTVLSNRHLPQRLDGLVSRLLAKDIAARPESMEEIIRELKDLSARGLQDSRVGADMADEDEITRTNIRRKGVLSLAWLIGCLLVGLFLIVKFYSENQAPRVKASAAPVHYRVSDNFDSGANITVPEDPQLILIQKGVSNVVFNDGAVTFNKWPHVDVGSFDKSRRVDQFMGSRMFEFPSGLVAGDFANGDISIKARGKVKVPENAVFNITADFKVSPQMIDGFKPDSILRLRLPRYISPNNEHFRHISRLIAIHELKFSDAVVDDETINLLNKLTNLRSLEMARVHFQTDRVDRMTCLQKLTNLRITRVEHVGKLLEKLSGSAYLRTLDLGECNLSDSDMEIVAQIPNLDYLGLEDNRYLTEAGIRPLLKIYGLKHLDLRKCHIGPAILDFIKSFHFLTQCDIATDSWTAAQKAELQSVLQHNGEQSR